MSVTNESDEKMNGSDGGSNHLKKGPWTSAEDATLIEYITKHGEGNWNNVQKNTGLSRCGKSCRLRWSNHLRPNLKKGAFSQEEEKLIIDLHSKMGNKWAQMAIQLPGRTDNEIKNYWNTRIKRRQRAGLPIYPPEICSQSQNESDNANALSSSSIDDSNYPNTLDIPIIEFKNLQFQQHQFYQDELLNFPTSYHSYPKRPLLSTIHPPPKRLRGPETFFGGPGQYQQISQSFMPSSSNSNSTFINGNHCSSSELPSFQTQVGSWVPPSSPLPSFESVDAFIQGLPNECTTSFPAQNNGMLDVVQHESGTTGNSENGETSYYAESDMIFGLEDCFSQDFNENDWGEAPLCHSSSLVFGENSFDDHEYLERMQGCNLQESAATLVPIQHSDRVETTNEVDFSDVSDCLIGDAVKKLISDGLSRNSNCSYSSPHVHDDSCAWNAMSTV